jgi:diguanylate cyclase (GGDEF)-like protein
MIPKLLKARSFKQQLITLFTIGIFCLSLIASLSISSLSGRTLHAQLLEQGRQLTLSFANRSKVALLYESAETAQEAIQSTLAFPDVVAAGIYTRSGKPLAQDGYPAANAQVLPAGETLHVEEAEDAWHFAADVIVTNQTPDAAAGDVAAPTSGEHVGLVRLTVTKHHLKALNSRIVRDNLMISSGLAALLLMLLLWVTTRLTTPLKNLADLMRRSEAGESNLRAKLGGPRDIQEMEQAFNTMMSELESREASLRRARDSALGMANAKAEFTAMVSHELRTPMNGVLGMLDLVREAGLNLRQEEYIKIARDSGNALLLLIDDILDFSRIEAGKLKIIPGNFQVRDLADDIVELLRLQATTKYLALNVATADNVPATAHADAGRIRQILINLLGNAIKFTEQGSVRLTVSLEHESDKPLLVFRVIDTGIGIPANALERIFEAFTQVDSSTTRRYSGTGLGLSISRQLARLMGGDITVSSQLDVGSTFTLTVPFVPAAAEVDSGAVMHSDQLAGIRLLSIGSNAEYGRWIGDHVTNAGGFSRHVTDTVQALDLLRAARRQNKPFDLLLIDELVGESAPQFAVAIAHEFDIAHARILLLEQPGANEQNFAIDPRLWTITRPLTGVSLSAALSAAIASPDTASMPVPAALPTPSAANADQRRPMVLIADDNHANLLVAQAMVERLGYGSIVVANGQQAVDVIESRDIALVLMDCYMPVLDGFAATEAIRHLRGHQRHLPVVAMTARVGKEDRQRCIEIGMDDILIKPLSFDALTHVFSKLLDGPKTVEAEADTSTEPASAAIDPIVIDRLRELVGEQKLANIVNAVLDGLPGHLQKLQTAVDANDIRGIGDVAHRLFGSVAHVGAHELAAACRRLEDAARTDETDAVSRLVADVMRLALPVRMELAASSAQSELDLGDDTNDRPYVLVVDDERSARLSIVGILEKDGYQLAEAENGAQAVQLCRARMPDLILMDAMMPEMDGFDACKTILSLPAAAYPPVLIVTALHDDEAVARAFAVGATDFVPKPINLLVLRKRVERILNEHSSVRQIQHLAYFDQLTGLPNRGAFLQRGGDLLEAARERGDQLALLFLDLDRFKMINDTLGHDAGDLLLCEAAKRLSSCVRSSDLVARLGGDEFTVILENIQSSDTVAKVAQKICRSFTEPFAIFGQIHHVHISVGIALFPQDGNDINALMKRADTAMFRAKAKGGAAFHYYEFGMEAEIFRKMELENELRSAVQHSQLELHYQPQIDLQTNRIRGLEALIRWRHPERGLVSPGEFIPLAEECGLIGLLGEWVISHVCMQLREWLDSQRPIYPVSVNVAYGQLVAGDLPNYIQSTLADMGVPPELLKLEFTESSLIDTAANAIAQMQRLTSLGIALEIDDFGTGYSSLSYLKHLPVDAMKIDRSFINDLLEDEASGAIVGGIISMGHKLGLQVIAEGVETAEQLALLSEQGCDAVQGFYFSRPLPVSELSIWIDRRREKTGEAV